MFRLAICDDSDADTGGISTALEGLRGLGISYEETCFSSGTSLVRAYEEGERFHAIILDMLMKPINGIDAAKGVRKFDLSVPILIVTSTKEFALDGYQVNAWQYLTKPLDSERFVREVRRILETADTRLCDYFVAETKGGLIKIRVDDILYFESRLHVVVAHTMTASHPFRSSLGAIERSYADRCFFRIHRSLLVNLRHVHRVMRQEVLLANGQRLELSRRRASALTSALLDYASTNQGILTR